MKSKCFRLKLVHLLSRIIKLPSVSSTPCVVVRELRVTAALCYQPTLSSLIPSRPSSGLSGSLEAQPWCTGNVQLWKPKPSLLPSLLHAAQRGPVPWHSPPYPDKMWKRSHRNAHAPRLKCTSCLSRLSRSIPAGSLSLLQGLCDQVSVVLCLLFLCWSTKAESLSQSIFFSFIISPHSHCILFLFYAIILFLFFNCICALS